ncbi:magnesium/cobalt transporter CorA [Phaeodactylibacter luteus]|uniref:Magnesium transport protein CorA n=1 Tax=Phaeodactylibacter luteus TaxID=1564516 RepID=A0A5C6RGJ4_9BACT|nr:magnesium/cobalt transporter CorA [Phaeodactylibacter luteus]TXB61558.1 magnesium/cobalt transporter CorA [Phaeodactylibacter luteus]
MSLTKLAKHNPVSRAVSKRKRKNTGLAPGSLVFTGTKHLEEAAVTLTEYHAEGVIYEQSSLGQLPTPHEGGFIRWYDIRGLHHVPLIQELGDLYNIHPLVLEDILDTQQRPKFEEYDNGLFLIVRALSLNAQEQRVETEQVGIFAGEGFVLSFQENETDLFSGVRDRIRSGRGKIKKRKADYLAYALADNIVDHYYVLLDQLDVMLDGLEEEILSDANRSTKGRIHSLKLQSITLRKSVAPLREAIGQFSRSDSAFIDEGTEVFIRDLHDHSVQVMDGIDTFRDMISGLYDLYLSEISFKMNSIMQVLTIISTIFIPLTFLAGIYGMNFDHMPELHWRYSYYVLWAVMALISAALIYYFRRRNWL